MVSTYTTTTTATDEATATMTSTVSKQQQDYHRARLLNRLGIYDDTQQQQQKQQSNKSNKRQRLVRPIILTAAEQRQHQILRSQGKGYIINPSPRDDGGNIRSPETGVKMAKTNLNCDFSHLPITTTATATTEEEEQKKGTRITFCEKVDVVLIPTRHEYSNRIKSLIWSDPQELQENTMRNAREFAAEGWKWENVIEDESMYVCSVSGELIHPIHMQQHLVPA